jgi:hypothetical protein
MRSTSPSGSLDYTTALQRARAFAIEQLQRDPSASFLIARSGCTCGTRVSGDISINIDDCFLSSPRIVNRKVSSMRRMSIPGQRFFEERSPRRNYLRVCMAPAFTLDNEAALDGLRRDVAEHRSAGRARVEFRRLDAPMAPAHSVATAFVKALALTPPETWTDLDRQGALEVLTRVLHADLAYDMPMMTIDMADALACRFLACCGDTAVFVTNGSLALAPTGGAWSPLTDATFDTGVIAVSARRVGMLWVEDED